MSDSAIRVENLSKQYRIGGAQGALLVPLFATWLCGVPQARRDGAVDLVWSE